MNDVIASLYKKNKITILIQHQRTNGPVNAHLISGPRISTVPQNMEKTRSRNYLDGDLQYSLSFTELVVCTFKFSGRWLQ